MSWLLFDGRLSERQLRMFRGNPPLPVLNLGRLPNPIGSWDAHNAVITGKARWPQGYHRIERAGRKLDGFRQDHVLDLDKDRGAMNSSYGTQGAFQFEVKGRPGMQVHAGRWWVPCARDHPPRSAGCRLIAEHQALGKPVPHVVPLAVARDLLSLIQTKGCIRTTENAMIAMRKVHAADPIKGIWVIEPGDLGGNVNLPPTITSDVQNQP